MGQAVSALAGSKRPLSGAFSRPGKRRGNGVATGCCELTSTSPSPVTSAKRPRISEVRNRELHDELVSQLQFYFSVANLRRDRFLVDQMWADPGGWVKVETLMTFNRIRKIGATVKDVVVALRAIEGVEVKETCITAGDLSGSSVRITGGLSGLNDVLMTEKGEDEEARTVYAEPFKADITHEEVGNKFGEYGTVVYISIPRFRDGKAKGFVFVEFEDAESAKRCVRCISIEKGPLRVMTKKKWVEKKEEYKRLKKQRKLQAKVRLATTREPTTVPPYNQAPVSKRQDDSEVLGSERGSETPSFTSGVVLSIKGLSKGKGVTRKALYESLEEYGPVAYVDLKTKAPNECRVRYMHPISAQNALKILSAENTKLLDAVISVRMLEGVEEKEYWDLIAIKMKERQRKRAARRAKKAKRRTGTKEASIVGDGSSTRQNKHVEDRVASGRKPSGHKILENGSENRKNLCVRSHIIFSDTTEDGREEHAGE